MGLNSKYKWVWLLLFLIPVFSVGAYYGYYYRENKRLDHLGVETGERELYRTPVPKELDEEMDLSAIPAVYQVVAVNGEQITIRHETPKSRQGQERVVTVRCEALGNKIYKPGAVVPLPVTRAGLLKEIAKWKPTRLLLSGKCGSEECLELTGQCSLTIKQEREYEQE